MPPISTTFDDETQGLISSAQMRQMDLADFQIPRLRDCRGPLTVQQNFLADLREDLDTFIRQIEALNVLVGDQNGERNRRELRQIVEDFQAALASLRKDFRAAILSSKRAIDSQKPSRREELLGSSAVKDSQSLNEKATEDSLMKTNDDVTEALRRTVTLMQNELERSVLATQMLDESSTTLRLTSNVHDTLNNVMDTSKQLIVALEKSDWLDRLLILTGLGFFLIVVLFILKQRIVDRGLRIAFWWTRFLPEWNFGSEVKTTGTQIGKVVGATTSATSAILSTVTSKYSLRTESTSTQGMDSTILDHISGMTHTSSDLVSSSTYPISATLSDSVRRTSEGVDAHDEL